MNPVFADRPKSIFPTMSAMARAHDAINLGQGFPDEDGPTAMLESAARHLLAGPNQYAPMEGAPELRQAIATANKRFYDLDVDWQTETLVLGGATEGLAAAFMGFCQPGDEVILFAPFYESYAPQAEAAGAVLKVVPLTAPDWRIEEAAVRAAITSKTRLIVINSPHNPTGRVLDADELGIIATLARDYDLTVLCDEVYEHMVFDGAQHTPLMTLPGMRERTVRLGSAGKTFSVTGWRIGYATGPAPLMSVLTKAHQYLAYTCPLNLQYAVAEALAYGDDYYDGLTQDMQRKRDILKSGLENAGFDVLPCEGAYFLNVDIRTVGHHDDRAFCEEITTKAKVAAVPVSAFYTQGQGERGYARFCFAKRPEVLEEAARRLHDFFAR